MFGKFLNNYYYGKAGKGDYRKHDLPQNRWQQFWEMLRVRLAGLFRMNLMTAIAFVPLIMVLVNTFSAVIANLVVVSEAAADLSAASAEQLQIYENRDSMLYSVLFFGGLWLIPAIAITGPVQAGMAYVTRNWARDEHAFVWSDFLDALKGNWKQALIASAITGLMPLVMLVCYQFYGAMARNNVFFVVPQMLTVALGLVWMMALTFLYPMMVTYRMGFGTLVRNSLLLTLGRLPHTAGLRLLMLLPFALAMVLSITANWMYGVMALAGYYLLIGNALARFVYAAFTNAVFDKYINPRIPGARTNRGLADPEDLDDPEEEEAPPPARAPENAPGTLV